ncbi:hypothetical protein KDK77_02985, partial [bacterium]|nr:hypothetical protein [bacterium]
MSRNHRFERAFLDQFEDRLRISIAIIALLFAVLFFVFWRVQVFNGGLYSDLARNNRIRKIIIPAPRGSLLDRKGVILADNRPSFDVEIVIEDIPRGRKKEIAGRLASVLNITEDVILEKIQSSRRVPYVPEKIARDISLETVTVIQEMREHFPGITITPVPVRDYRFGTFASHVIGYLGKLSPDEYKNLKDSGYYIQDYIGKMGIEKAAERYLKGEHGGMQVQVDYRGYTDKVLGIKNPVQGNNVYLTIDHHIQEKAETLMAEKSGAIIVMDTRNGDVLALVSAPEFDPNLFIKPTDPAIIQDIFQSEKKYLLNKATRELYPPGSTFKLLIAMAAMENAGLSMVKKYDCRGAFKLGGFTFHCWYRKGHGTLNVSEA